MGPGGEFLEPGGEFLEPGGDQREAITSISIRKPPGRAPT
jgi:hypothetical protein